MPTLPSGRRVEFSLDRFNALLDQIPLTEATVLCDALIDPDDLMHVLDIVLFDDDGAPYFAGHLLSQWHDLAAAWDKCDSDSFSAYLASAGSIQARADAIASLKHLIARMQAVADTTRTLTAQPRETLLQAA